MEPENVLPLEDDFSSSKAHHDQVLAVSVQGLITLPETKMKIAGWKMNSMNEWLKNHRGIVSLKGIPTFKWSSQAEAKFTGPQESWDPPMEGFEPV